MTFNKNGVFQIQGYRQTETVPSYRLWTQGAAMKIDWYRFTFG